MALFTKDTIDRVREAVDMVQLVGQKTDLRRVGTRWSGLCPFHDERTPSFSVNPEEKLYYCFGCGEGGRRLQVRPADRGARLPGGRGAAGGAVGRAGGAGGRRSARGGAPPPARAPARPARAREPLLLRLPARVGRGGAGARVPGLTRPVGRGARRVPRGLLAERVGPDDHGRPAERLQRGGARGGRARAARARTAACTTASAGGSCSRWRTRAGRCSASARGRWGRGAGRST